MSKSRLAKSAAPLPTAPHTFQQDLARILTTNLSDLFKRAEPAHADAEGDGDGNPAYNTALAESLIRDAVRERATDIHIDPLATGSRVRFRVDGRVVDILELSDNQANRLVNQIKTLADIDPVRTFGPLDARLSYDLDDRIIDIRLTVVPSVTGEKIAIRLLDPVRARAALDELGLTAAHLDLLRLWLSAAGGLFMVTGPTGSGKTTLLYALLHELRRRASNIITIEDPVEYQIDGITQIQVDHRHGLDFGAGLKTMLRLDPDYLMLGEIRDASSARSAMDASISGRSLMTTLHSRDAVSSLSALRNWGATDLEIAVSLSIVVAQRLVRVLCPACRRERAITEAEALWARGAGVPAPRSVWEPVGCDECRHMGYKGRTGVFEVWRLDDEDYGLVLGGIDEHAMRRRLNAKGHRTLAMHGVELVAAGVTGMTEIFGLPGVSLNEPALTQLEEPRTIVTDAAPDAETALATMPG